jgi:hypothetical protein
LLYSDVVRNPFKTIMTAEIDDLRGHVIIVDPYIHEKAKLTRGEFLEKVSRVKAIRTNENYSYISFYITDFEGYSNLQNFYDLINKGIFSFKGYHSFLIAVQPKLYYWFKHTDYSIIEKQITTWLTALYFFNPDKRKIFKDQIYKPLFEEVLKNVDKHFKDFHPVDKNELLEKLLENQDETILDIYDLSLNKYLEVCKTIYGGEPPEFLRSPFDYENIKEWGVNEHFNFVFIEAYFTESDWDRIINKGSEDDMWRTESRDDLWEKWKHTYGQFDRRQNFVYSFFFEQTGKGKIADKIKKRETIPARLRDKIWNRDDGKCVECGTKENLEFDHIIPFSKGGATTYRNLQLLCEPCNRKKRAKIGE